MNHATNQTTESNNPIQKLDIVWGTVCPCQCPWNQQTWRSQCSKWKVIHSRCSYMMSQKGRRLPPEKRGLNTPCSSIAGLQWGLSADTEHMEWIMGLITSIQELPGVRQKSHNAHFMAWIACLNCRTWRDPSGWSKNWRVCIYRNKCYCTLSKSANLLAIFNPLIRWYCLKDVSSKYGKHWPAQVSFKEFVFGGLLEPIQRHCFGYLRGTKSIV